MKLFKSILRKFVFHKNSIPRLTVETCLSCHIRKHNSEIKYVFQIAEISNRSVVILANNGFFQLNEAVTVHLKIDNGDQLIVSGLVTNQFLRTVNDLKLIEDATFRVHILFQEPFYAASPDVYCDPWK